MEKPVIIQETLQCLRDSHGEVLAAERIERLVVGVFFTAVQLAGGSCGVARSDLTGLDCSASHGRNLGEFAPGRLTGKPILDVLGHPADRLLFDSVKMAILNAVSAGVTARAAYPIEVGRDPIEWIDSSPGQRVVLVGAFPAYMDRLAEQPCTLQVLELDEAAFPARHRHRYVPAAQAGEVLPRADSVILTGSTLVNHTLHDLLPLIPPAAFTALVGPSSGLLPEVLFRHGIDLIGTIRILDPDTLFRVVGEGGAGYHLFRTCAEKICIFHG